MTRSPRTTILTQAVAEFFALEAELAGSVISKPVIGNLYDAAGGEDTFTRLVDRFYAGVADDPLLRPLYPDEDLAGARERLTLFLIQYWGGPTTYNDRRGHPRLRMRHAPFPIGPRERDAWLGHMTAAVDSLELPRGVRVAFLEYFEAASTAMMNRPT